MDTRTIACCSAALAATLLGGRGSAQSTVRASVGPTGGQGDFHSVWGVPSADGRYVAFESFAANLVVGDSNFHLPDVFVKDLQTGAVVLASVDSAGVQGNSGSVIPSMSADGRYVAFESLASNLVVGDSNSAFDVFVHDLVTGATTRVSTDSGGNQGNAESHFAAISADGRFVAFESDATNLVAGDTNGLRDVFRHELATGATVRVCVGLAGLGTDGASKRPAISADGRYVAYVSAATNLVSGDTNAVEDVFVWDGLDDVTTRVSVDSAGSQAELGSSTPSISGDGRFVAFGSDAANLVPGDTNVSSDVFVHDLANATTTRVSIASTGTQGNALSSTTGSYQISTDGRFVAFESSASNLVVGDTNAASDCFVHDRLTGETTRANVTTSGAQAGGARAPALSPDGRYVVFDTNASNVVPGDTNNFWDVFRRDRGAVEPTAFCFGDGSSMPCPCGNSGAAGHGCANSISASGAALTASGTTSVSADNFVLSATSMSGNVSLYLQGTAQADLPLDDGKTCVGGSLVRVGLKSVTAGASTNPSGIDLPISVKGGVPINGGTRFYQVAYRNADPTFCQPATTNRTNGMIVVWQH